MLNVTSPGLFGGTGPSRKEKHSACLLVSLDCEFGPLSEYRMEGRVVYSRAPHRGKKEAKGSHESDASFWRQCIVKLKLLCRGGCDYDAGKEAVDKEERVREKISSLHTILKRGFTSSSRVLDHNLATSPIRSNTSITGSGTRPIGTPILDRGSQGFPYLYLCDGVHRRCSIDCVI